MLDSALLRDRLPITFNGGQAIINAGKAVKLDLPWLAQQPAHDGRAVLVAGGPSLNDCFEHVRVLQKHGWTVFCVNNTARVLLENGIAPDYHVLLDMDPGTAGFITPFNGTKYLLASQCDPKVFDAAPGGITLWHPHIEGINEVATSKPTTLIGGGCTCGLAAIAIAHAMGFRRMDFVGYDSSYRNGEGHAYKQEKNNGENIVHAVVAGRTFDCAVWMLHQVEDFKLMVDASGDTKGAALHQMVDA